MIDNIIAAFLFNSIIIDGAILAYQIISNLVN